MSALKIASIFLALQECMGIYSIFVCVKALEKAGVRFGDNFYFPLLFMDVCVCMQ